MSEIVSVIVPTYCPDDAVVALQKTFLRSLNDFTLRGCYQLVVIENGSSMFDTAMVSPDLYIQNPEPLGYARAVNAGIALAAGNLLIVANNDLVLSPNWLPQLIKDYKAWGPGILSPMEVSRPGAIYHDQSWYSLFITDRKTWQTVGYFDETLPYRFHDQKHAINMKQAGFIVARTGNVVVKHVNSATYSKMELREQETLERQRMIDEFGAAHFHEWLQLKRSA